MHDHSPSPLSDEAYARALAQEAEVWGADAVSKAGVMAPDWLAYRRVPELAIVEEQEIGRLLALIKPACACWNWAAIPAR
jgi:hypothetical protein